MRQSKAGKKLSSLQRKVTGEIGEDGRPVSPYRAWAAQKATGRDSLALGREVDKNISDVKNSGVTTGQHAEYLEKVAVLKANGIADPHKEALKSMNDYTYEQSMKGFDSAMAEKVAKTAIMKDENATRKIGAVKNAVAVSKPGTTDADLEKAVVQNLAKLNKNDAGAIKESHLQDLVDTFGQDGAKQIILKAWKPEKISVMMDGAMDTTSAKLDSILGEASPTYVPPPAPPPDPHLNPPANSPYTQPLPTNEHEDSTAEWGPGPGNRPRR